MSEEQPTFKVVDRRPFNPDGSPRELSPQEKEEAERAANAVAAENAAAKEMSSPAAPKAEPRRRPSPAPAAPSHQAAREGDPLDDPASFLSLIMSLASNAAASLGMMPHPVTGETGVDLGSATHWIDVPRMLERKTKGNLDQQAAQLLESLLADVRMQYGEFFGSPTPPAPKVI